MGYQGDFPGFDQAESHGQTRHHCSYVEAFIVGLISVEFRGYVILYKHVHRLSTGPWSFAYNELAYEESHGTRNLIYPPNASHVF